MNNSLLSESVNEYTVDKLTNLPASLRKLIYAVEKSRAAAYYYRNGYVALINAMRKVLCIDKAGFKIYDDIIKKTKKAREDADRLSKKDCNVIDLSNRIEVIKEWERIVKARKLAEKRKEITEGGAL